MAEGKGQGKVNYDVVAEMGAGLVIARVSISVLREQDINARIMKTEMQKQLTDNIKKRGQLESLPFCTLIDGKIEIVSGHHRIRAARDSGVIKDIYVVLDVSGLRRSAVAAKQIAHNAINGFDDQSTLKEIAKLITEVDDMLESFIGKDVLAEPIADLEKLLSPKVEFEWKNIMFSFLPHQVNGLETLVKVVESVDPDIIGVGPVEAHKPFVEALTKYQKFADVKNIGATIYAMIRATEQKLEDIGFDDSQEWEQLSSIFGSPAIPKESADVIREALNKMESNGMVEAKNKWQAIEQWATRYVNGGGNHGS